MGCPLCYSDNHTAHQHKSYIFSINPPHFLNSYPNLAIMSDSPSSNTAVFQRTAEAEMTWDNLNKEDDCAVTELNNKVISRLPEAGTVNQSLARKELTECNSKLAEIRALLVRFEAKTKGAQDLIKEYVLIFQ
jgi:hypothetical protein